MAATATRTIDTDQLDQAAAQLVERYKSAVVDVARGQLKVDQALKIARECGRLPEELVSDVKAVDALLKLAAHPFRATDWQQETNKARKRSLEARAAVDRADQQITQARQSYKSAHENHLRTLNGTDKVEKHRRELQEQYAQERLAILAVTTEDFSHLLD